MRDLRRRLYTFSALSTTNLRDLNVSLINPCSAGGLPGDAVVDGPWTGTEIGEAELDDAVAWNWWARGTEEG